MLYDGADEDSEWFAETQIVCIVHTISGFISTFTVFIKDRVESEKTSLRSLYGYYKELRSVLIRPPFSRKLLL